MVMSNKTINKILCNECGGIIEYGVYDLVDVTDDDSLKERVMNDELFVVKCPHCGKAYYLTYDFIYNDRNVCLMIYYGNDKDKQSQLIHEVIEKSKSMDRKIEYAFRCVEDYDKLREKIHIFNCGYDDRIIELYKYEYIINGYDKDLKMLDDIVFTNYDGSVENVFVLFEKDEVNGVRAISFNDMEYTRLLKEYGDLLYETNESYDIDLLWAQELYEKVKEDM